MADSKKHTEGPWERVDTADYAEIHPAGKRLRSAIALVEKPEDADLVAAAPDLLEALRHLVKQDYNVVTGRGFEPEALTAAIAAIARAEGRS